MYLTFQDYSKLNEWCNTYMKEDNAVVDFVVIATTTGCKVTAIVREDKNDFQLYADLYIGECNPFSLYNYNKFKEDMHLLIGQKVMESGLI